MMRGIDAEKVLSTQEAAAVILALVRGMGDQGATEEDMERAIEWARGARIEAAMLEHVLDGKVTFWFDPSGEMRFKLFEPPAEQEEPVR